MIITTEQLAAFLQTLKEQEVSPGHWNRIACSGVLPLILDRDSRFTDLNAIRVALGLPIPTLSGPLYLSIDPARSIREMVDAGRYDSVSRELDPFLEMESAQESISGKVEVKLFDFDHSAFRQSLASAVAKEDESHPWSLAGLRSLFAFGAKYAQAQRECPIIAAKFTFSVYRSPLRTVGYHVTKAFALGTHGSRRVVRDVRFERMKGKNRYLLVRLAKTTNETSTRV